VERGDEEQEEEKTPEGGIEEKMNRSEKKARKAIEKLGYVKYEGVKRMTMVQRKDCISIVS
jgi:hypothetical protein